MCGIPCISLTTSRLTENRFSHRRIVPIVRIIRLQTHNPADSRNREECNDRPVRPGNPALCDRAILPRRRITTVLHPLRDLLLIINLLRPLALPAERLIPIPGKVRSQALPPVRRLRIRERTHGKVRRPAPPPVRRLPIQKTLRAEAIPDRIQCFYFILVAPPVRQPSSNGC